MTLFRFIPIGLALLFALSITLSSTDAHARRGVAVFNTGEQLFEVGDLPEEMVTPETKGLAVGSLCTQYGIFWAGVWTMDCRLVAYNPTADSYGNFSPEQLAVVEKVYNADDGKRSIWNRYGGIAIIVIILGLIVFGMFGKDDDE